MSNEDLESLKNFARAVSAKAGAAYTADASWVVSQDRQHASARWDALHDVIKDEADRINSIRYQIGVDLKLKKLVMGHSLFGSYAVTAKSMDEHYAIMNVFQYERNTYDLIVEELSIHKPIREVKREPARYSGESVEEIRGVLNSMTRKVIAFKVDKVALDRRPKLGWENTRLAESTLIVDVEPVRL